MTDSPPAPGRDEIVVTVPAARAVCHSREHTRLGCLAEVTVTFGEFGTQYGKGALWPDTWGHSYPMCSECWDTTRQIAQHARPRLTITDTRPPAG